MTASRIPGLDALRGLAALLVLAYHARGYVLPEVLFSHGYLAVDLFFVISGLVLARAYDSDLALGQGVIFMRRRLKRLYPMVMLGMALGALLWLAHGDDLGVLVLLLGLGALFIPFIGGRHLFPLNGPQWSLLWELVANIAYALIAPWLTTRRLMILVALSGLCHAVLILSNGTGQLGPHGANWWGGASRVTFGFFAGVLLARLDAKRVQAIPTPPVTLLLAAVTLLLSPPLPEVARAGFDLVAVLLACPLLTACALRAQLGRLAPLLNLLAGISYALYALHIPIILAANEVARQVPEGLTRWFVNALALPIALLAAWAAHRWFEPWAARRLDRKPQGFSISAPSSSTR